MMDSMKEGSSDENTCATTISCSPDSIYSEDDLSTDGLCRVRVIPAPDNGPAVVWDPSYEFAENDEYLAFCLEGFLAEMRWPEEEITFTAKGKDKKVSCKKAKLQEETVSSAKKAGNSKKKKTNFKKENTGKDTKSPPTENPTKPKTKKAKKKLSDSKHVKTQLDTTTSSKKSKSSYVKSQLDSTRSKKSKSSHVSKKKSQKVSTVHVLSRQDSFSSTSSGASFFDDADNNLIDELKKRQQGKNPSKGKSLPGDIQELDKNGSPKRKKLEPIDEEKLRDSLRVSLHLAATDAASIGRLTRLSENVVEAVAVEPAIKEDKDDWKLKKSSVVDNELSRSNHFKIINEAAAVGQLKRLKSYDLVSIETLAEVDEEDNSNDQEDISKSFDFLKKRRKLLLSSTARMERYLKDEAMRKRTTLYAPEHVLERQQNKVEIAEKFAAGDLKWLPSSEIPRFRLPKVYLSRNKIRAAVAKEAADFGESRAHRLRCIFRLNMTERCKCMYCKNASPLQTHAYQQLRLQEQILEEAAKIRKNDTTNKGSMERKEKAQSFVPHSRNLQDPEKLYSRTALRRSSSLWPITAKDRSSAKAPAWASPPLRKTSVNKKSKEELQQQNTPIWVLATGKRDDSLPEWASDTLREMVGGLKMAGGAAEIEHSNLSNTEAAITNEIDNGEVRYSSSHHGNEMKNDIPSSPTSVDGYHGSM